jgi:CubicO group peptidase (beta-lactamase class C family)
LVGEVHDDNAYAMGGVAGHAGLFGSALGVAQLAQEWLEAFLGHHKVFNPELVRRFWQRSSVPGSTRVVGFDTPSPVSSQAGSRMGKRTIGHTGFTGTSLWIDPDRELTVILLTNRVHPNRANEAIRAFRPRLHDAVIGALESGGNRR